MGDCVADKCCCCIDLKTGCFIIAYLSLIFYTAIIITTLVVGTVILANGSCVAVIQQIDNECTDAQFMGIGFLIVFGILLLIMVFFLTFVIVLLVGLHKNKPGLVEVYLIFTIVCQVLTIVGFSVTLLSGIVTMKSIVEQTVNILVSAYFSHVIRSQYIVMKRTARGPAIYNPAHGPAIYNLAQEPANYSPSQRQPIYYSTDAPPPYRFSSSDIRSLLD